MKGETETESEREKYRDRDGQRKGASVNASPAIDSLSETNLTKREGTKNVKNRRARNMHLKKKETRRNEYLYNRCSCLCLAETASFVTVFKKKKLLSVLLSLSLSFSLCVWLSQPKQRQCPSRRDGSIIMCLSLKPALSLTPSGSTSTSSSSQRLLPAGLTLGSITASWRPGGQSET